MAFCRYKFLNKSAEFITKIETMIREPSPQVSCYDYCSWMVWLFKKEGKCPFHALPCIFCYLLNQNHSFVSCGRQNRANLEFLLCHIRSKLLETAQFSTTGPQQLYFISGTEHSFGDPAVGGWKGRNSYCTWPLEEGDSLCRHRRVRQGSRHRQLRLQERLQGSDQVEQSLLTSPILAFTACFLICIP